MTVRASLDIAPEEPAPDEAHVRVPPVVLVLARILVARALEDEGVIAPANDNLRLPR